MFRSSYRDPWYKQGWFVIAALVGVAIVLVVGLAVHDYAKIETVTLHVTGKESVNTKDGHEYRVYAQEDTYKIGDSIVHPRFNSANFYGKLPVPAGGPGATENAVVLKCKVFGWRIPLFSSFKNIDSCEGV